MLSPEDFDKAKMQVILMSQEQLLEIESLSRTLSEERREPLTSIFRPDPLSLPTVRSLLREARKGT